MAGKVITGQEVDPELMLRIDATGDGGIGTDDMILLLEKAAEL